MNPLAILLLFAVAGGGGAKKKKKRKPFKLGPVAVGTFGPAAAPKIGPVFTGDWTFVGDHRPTPGEHGSVNSKWCMPKIAGGGCRTVPIELGFPANWVSAEALQIELVQSPKPLSLKAMIESFARSSKDKAASLEGRPEAYTEFPCVRYNYVGTSAGGLIPMVQTDQNPGGMSGKDLQRCGFALDVNPPELRVVHTEGIYKLVLTINPGRGSMGLYRILADWKYV